MNVNVGGKGAVARGFASCRVAYLFDRSPSDEERPVVFLAPREGSRQDAIREFPRSGAPRPRSRAGPDRGNHRDGFFLNAKLAVPRAKTLNPSKARVEVP